MDFFDFCTCGAEGYAQLKQCIDYCADRGYSYEFPPCRLPEGCSPSLAQVGFWRDRGDYLLYLRPAVRYEGTDGPLGAFFRAGSLLRFPSFPALVDRLRGLAGRDGGGAGSIFPGWSALA